MVEDVAAHTQLGTKGTILGPYYFDGLSRVQGRPHLLVFFEGLTSGGLTAS